jgi:outer membrane lipoprotein-sorting protein
MRSSARWLVPVAVAAAVAGGVAVSSAQAGTSPDLPASTPQKVLASVADSKVTALSGTVVTKVDVGLPSLSGIGGAPASEAGTDPAGLLTRFLTGKNTLRVWADGPTRQRAQLVDPFSELDVVRNGTDVWAYSSRENVAEHGTIPAHQDAAKGKEVTDLTPAQLADRAIAAADPTTTVTLGEPLLVAGRSAYALTLTPRTDATLVGRVVVAVDAEKGVPLQVQVFARGHAEPSIDTGFTSIDYRTPSADRFRFTPPAGAKVEKLDLPTERPAVPEPLAAAVRPTVSGTGWASVVEVPALAVRAATGQHSTASPGATGDGAAALQQLTTPAGDGGRAISTSLVSVLFTKDGRVLAGAVPVQALVAAAAK